MSGAGRQSAISSELVRNVSSLLQSVGIRAAVFGGMGMRIRGAQKPTPTADLDFLAVWSGRRLSGLRELIKIANGHWGPNFEERHRLMPRVVRFRINSVPVDLLRAESRQLRAVLDRATLCHWNDLRVRTLEIEDILLIKLRFACPKDLKDVQLALDRPKLVDRAILADRAKQWGISAGGFDSLGLSNNG